VNLTTDTLRLVMADMEKALAEVAAKHGLQQLQHKGVTYDSHAGTFRFQVYGTVDGGTSKEQATYQYLMRRDPELPGLGTKFKSAGRYHEIVGANKACSILTSCDGKTYVWKNRDGLKACIAMGRK
jgi:hypothetical protein